VALNLQTKEHGDQTIQDSGRKAIQMKNVIAIIFGFDYVISCAQAAGEIDHQFASWPRISVLPRGQARELLVK
jgi:hypothetical protein